MVTIPGVTAVMEGAARTSWVRRVVVCGYPGAVGVVVGAADVRKVL